MSVSIKPLFPYYGSKWNIARHYPAPEAHVVEPFAGAAGYSCFYGVRQAILVDKDPIIAGLWKYLIGVSPSEVMSLPDMPEIGDCVDNYDIPQEAKWLIGFWLNRGSATPKKTRTAYSARSDRGQLNWGQRAKERIASQLPQIAEWQVIEGSYEQSPNCEATWFVDPPYGDKGRFYRVGFADFDQLGQWCLRRRGTLIACEGEGAKWLPFEPLGSFKSSKGRATEVAYIRCATTPPTTNDAKSTTYQSAADCPLGSAHGSASTYGDANGIDCCDFCGFPADNQPTTNDAIPAGGHVDTEGEAMAMFDHLNCPLCAGSGHVEDAEALRGLIVALLSALDDIELPDGSGDMGMPATVEDAAGDLADAIGWTGEPAALSAAPSAPATE